MQTTVSPVAVFWIGQDPMSLQLTRISAEFCARLGYTVSELAGTHFADLAHPEDRTAELTAYVAAIRAHRDNYDLRMRCRTKSGSPVSMHIASTIVRDKHGIPSRVVSIVRPR